MLAYATVCSADFSCRWSTLSLSLSLACLAMKSADQIALLRPPRTAAAAGPPVKANRVIYTQASWRIKRLALVDYLLRKLDCALCSPTSVPSSCRHEITSFFPF